MRKPLSGAVALCLLTASAAFAEVHLQLQDGRVSITAKDATVRQILTEWARVGQTKVVNLERIPGAPLTIELSNIPEGQALDMLLRSVSGYVAAPRPAAVANLSVFDRIIVMPTMAAPRTAAAAQPAQTFQQPQFAPAPPPPDDDQDEPPAANVQMPAPPRAPVFNSFPPPQQVGGAGVTGGVPTARPAGIPTAAPGGSVTQPGMMTPVPQPEFRPGLSPSVQQPPPQATPTAQPGQIGQPASRPGRSGGPGAQ